MEAWRMFKPLPVAMITSVEEDGSFRCSPFTWLIPVSKESGFVVMMRKESKTLDNLRERPKLAVAWMPPAYSVAQAVKETKSPLNPFKFEMMTPDGFSMPVPAVSIYSLEAEVIMIESMEKVFLEWTHEMVFCRAVKEFVRDRISIPLLHMGFKSFAVAQEFQVEGY
jgi:flavin reductase (DIM6/NTAB) family NADH-FMN oxidoreductase RutF